jgi:DNA segregation ATPase FtsK/SpoIIIE-like protein
MIDIETVDFTNADPFLKKAIKAVNASYDKVSCQHLQRLLRIGYNRARRLADKIESLQIKT